VQLKRGRGVLCHPCSVLIFCCFAFYFEAKFRQLLRRPHLIHILRLGQERHPLGFVVLLKSLPAGFFGN
jgi:hypothetical protein